MVSDVQFDEIGPPLQGSSRDASNLPRKSDVMELTSWLTCSLALSLVRGRSVLGRPRIGATHANSSAETYGMCVVVFMLGSYGRDRTRISHIQGGEEEAGASGSIDLGRIRDTDTHTVTHPHPYLIDDQENLVARKATRTF